jgi:hypothetical protein
MKQGQWFQATARSSNPATKIEDLKIGTISRLISLIACFDLK